MHKGKIVELTITDLAFGGKGISKVVSSEQRADTSKNNTAHRSPLTALFPIFVDGALPGQTVEAKITKKKRRHAEAKCLKVLERSADEVDHEFQDVPGAPWAHLPVEIQQRHKQQQVFDLFQKFADTDLTSIFDQYLSSPDTWNYRNKMEYSFGPTTEEQNEGGEWEHTGFGLGSKKRGQFWLVENLKKDSGLFDADFEFALSQIRDWCKSINPSPYNSRKNTGFWRSLLVRRSLSENKFLVNMITNHVGADDISPRTENLLSLQKSFVDLLQTILGNRLQGVYWTQSNDLGNAATKYQQRDLIYGKPTLNETINGLDFTISIDSFFQTNVRSAEKLYNKAISYLAPDATKIFDLFCGTGTIGQIVASQRPESEVFGVEIVESAIEDAKANAKLNNLTNVDFVAADLNKWIKANALPKNATVILDPPRAGISPKALQRIIDAKPTQIVYVSCNPATMARDTALLKEGGFELQKLSLVDQFPHTAHVEAVGSFKLNQKPPESPKVEEY